MKITYLDKISTVARAEPRQFKVTSKDLNEIKQAHNSSLEALGWEEYRDTVDSEASPQVFTAGQSLPLSINGMAKIISQSPADSTGLWDSVNDKIRPIKVGDSYMVRVDFKAKIASNDGFFDFSLNVGGTIGEAFGETKLFPKGLGVEHRFSIDFPIYSLDTFIANGGELLITPSHTMQVYSKRIIIWKVLDGK